MGQVQRSLKRSERSGTDLELFFPVPHNTRAKEHGEKCSGARSKADKRKYFFTQHTITLWNLLPQDVMEAKSINEFKKRIRQIHATSGSGSLSTADYQELGGYAGGRITLYSPASDIPS